MEAPYYGYGFCDNHGVHDQNIEGFTYQYGVLNGVGHSQPVQWPMHCQGPNGLIHSHSSSTSVHVGSNPYYINRGIQTIQGDVVQHGTFNGRGMGARVRGHFSVSGDIN
ncbi:uncharacterized protein LOC129319821 [Prosopis cineraria]|nr:uncharacterized protein LOC129319821 [Prosopis cineraria]